MSDDSAKHSHSTQSGSDTACVHLFLLIPLTYQKTGGLESLKSFFTVAEGPCSVFFALQGRTDGVAPANNGFIYLVYHIK